MAKSVLGTVPEHTQSKLQENSGTDSHSVLLEGADNPRSLGFKGHNPDSPPLYIVGDVSPTPPSIPFHHVENIIQAAAFARLTGRPLYHHLTIRWPKGDWQCHEATLRAIAEWQRYHVGCAAYVWAKEANRGAHSHILLHLPRDKSRKFRKAMTKQLKKLTGLKSLPSGTIQSRRIWSHGDPFQHMRNRVAYILKRADEDTRRMLGVRKRDSGQIDGKAIGVSQSLNMAARREAKSVLPSGHRQCPPLLRQVLLGSHISKPRNYCRETE